MPHVEQLTALEILDSRGRPTVQATCRLASGATGTASVPSGASTGAAEAVELRDGDPLRYDSRGCRKAVAAIEGELNAGVSNRDITSQADLDGLLIAIEGMPNKSRLGGNSLLAVSLAFARAVAAEDRLPLYRHFARLWGAEIRGLPRMSINLFSGGLHAGGQVPIQDVLIVPTSSRSIDEGLVMASAVYRAAVVLVREKYQMRWLTADEGGLAPPASGPEALFDDAVAAIRAAGLEPGRDVSLAIDVAASHFYRDGAYWLDEQPLTGGQMIERIAGWVERWPILSVEDGLAEDDWRHWPHLNNRLGERTLILGDDLLCTNPARIERAIAARACGALLLKVNQIGTLTEALQAYRLARAAGWQVVASVRSGDTEDDWFSDLAVGIGADYTKAGSLTQSERLAKYNRLLAIESELCRNAKSGKPQAAS